ncbi:hypothetical protein [Pseudoalteromonas maricaloris]|uniref:Uncharacterized protein n=1 Tax=Pseudoalteromonas maricaloris TaxID=184924 RepID=A0A8I2H1S5_9GAMM|nr:hypothetical protein [Pseudoalteromonas maricaloris]NLR21778.1 hypothetical protein [Pseudoalteromonas maricaloris]WOX28318.1 hypothetical protein R5H13_17070 [Pseudoalteromonas maricaloris]
MNNIRIKDLSRAKLTQSEYDLAIFAVGYEPRCTHLFDLLEKSKINDILLLAYEESQQNEMHKLHLANFGINDVVILTHSEIREVYSALIKRVEALSVDKETFKVLIDYSSMSRNWYAAILNYFFNILTIKVEVTMVYSCAEYPLSSDFLDFELGDVKVLPGCQGSPITKKKTAGIFMLGFDRVGPLSFYNLLEPDLVYGVVSSPGSLPNYEEKAREINNQFIQHQLNNGENLIGAPIFSVAQTYENLCQLIRPIKNSYNISIVQFGPKPHLLASTIAGLVFRNVSCIYSEYKRTKHHHVKASGDLVITLIERS